MTPRNLGLVAVLSAAVAALAAGASDGYWLEAVPHLPGEAALRQAIERGPFAGTQGAIDALDAVSRSHPGTPASGLAQLTAGLRLLEAGEAEQALVRLRHQDIKKTLLTDHALLGVARGLEESDNPAAAVAAYLAAADVEGSPVVCGALLRGAEVQVEQDSERSALSTLNRVLLACPGQEPRALLQIGEIHESLRQPREAAQAFDRVDRDYPTSPQAAVVASRLSALKSHLEQLPPELERQRALTKADAFFAAGRWREAVAAYGKLLKQRGLAPEDAERARVRYGRALGAVRRYRQARSALVVIAPDSRYAAEATYYRARYERASRRVPALETVTKRFSGTPWAERALFDLGNHYQKDMHTGQALPFYRRLLTEFPDGRYVERATWYVGWGDYLARRYEPAATTFEATARLRPTANPTPSFLYWAARARLELSQQGRARQLLEETVQRYKNSYYGLRAAEALAEIAPGSNPRNVTPLAPPRLDIVQPHRARVRQLLLIDRFDEAREELRGLDRTPALLSTIAWIEHRRGRFLAAIRAMKQAFPSYLSAEGDRLPNAVWRILYPLEFRQMLEGQAARRSLDPALVAALVRQESTFDTEVVSRAGARGLMQIMPATGRRLARASKVRYRRSALHDPATNLSFGTLYLRQMLDRFDGRVELALAAYNAGPNRVIAWTARKPQASPEEFIESIPFTETRNYVKVVLAGREQYRRIYSLSAAGTQTAAGTSVQ